MCEDILFFIRVDYVFSLAYVLTKLVISSLMMGQRRVVWSRWLSLNLGGDDSYYRDGSREVEVFL